VGRDSEAVKPSFFMAAKSREGKSPLSGCSWLKPALAGISCLPLASCTAFKAPAIKAVAPGLSGSEQCRPITRECQRLCFDALFQEVCHEKASKEKWVELSSQCVKNLQRMKAGEMPSTRRRPSCTEMELVLERITDRLSPALNGNLNTQDWIEAVSANLYPPHRQQLIRGTHPPR
jgi:hypothetical protein